MSEVREKAKLAGTAVSVLNRLTTVQKTKLCWRSPMRSCAAAMRYSQRMKRTLSGDVTMGPLPPCWIAWH